MGGPGLEHPVSLNTGKNVLQHLNYDRYESLAVVIGKDNLWSIGDGPMVQAELAITELKKLDVGIIFLALHGTFGEDGTVQGLLDATDLPYTGSPNGASAICINKIATKALLDYHDLPVARDLVVSREECCDSALFSNSLRKIPAANGGPGYPCVVKAPNQGSSFGVFIAQSEEELIEGLKDPVFQDEPVLVEQFIDGTELTCGILETKGGELKVLPVTEIVPLNASFFDYKAKYTTGATDEITPARISEELKFRIQAMTRKAFTACGCRGVARVDFFAKEDELYIIEVNTLPGLTKNSLLPQEAAEAGIDFETLLTTIIESGLERFKGEGKSR